MTYRKPISKRIVIQLIKTHGVLCQSCNNQEFEHIHHIDSDPSNNDFTNLMLLCIDCHNKTHFGTRILTPKISSYLLEKLKDSCNTFIGRPIEMGKKKVIIIPTEFHNEIKPVMNKLLKFSWEEILDSK